MSDCDRERDAFLLGEQDFYDGVPIGDCPYPMSIHEPDSGPFVRWCQGWHHGEARAARLTLELQLHPICADDTAERKLVSWVINDRHSASARKEARQERRTLH